MTAHRLAMASPRVTSTCIESDEFGDLSGRYQVLMVPKMVVNEHYDFTGALPEEPFLSHVLRGSRAG